MVSAHLFMVLFMLVLGEIGFFKTPNVSDFTGVHSWVIISELTQYHSERGRDLVDLITKGDF